MRDWWLRAAEKGGAMGGAQEVITAPTVEELEAKVAEWYERAEGMGLEDARIPWDPALVQEREDGYVFSVWAHS